MFYEGLILDTPEVVVNMGKALERYEREGGYWPKGEMVICRDPDKIRRVIESRTEWE